MKFWVLIIALLFSVVSKGQDTLKILLGSKQIYNALIKDGDTTKKFGVSKKILKEKFTTVRVIYKQHHPNRAYKNQMQFSFIAADGREITYSLNGENGKYNFKANTLKTALLNKVTVTLSLVQDPVNPQMMIPTRMTTLLLINML